MWTLLALLASMFSDSSSLRCVSSELRRIFEVIYSSFGWRPDVFLVGDQYFVFS
jgi:hypothetical protein